MYDIVIVGAGPAGLAASIYASRFKLKNLVVGELLGGTIIWAHEVDNYPGLPGISGVELGQKLINHAKKLGGEVINEGVKEVGKKEGGFWVRTNSGKLFGGKTLILATGTERRKLGVPGESEYIGKGVSYCPTCDGYFYRGKRVVIVGGSNAACSSAIYLASLAKEVFLVYRRSTLRAEPVWVEEIQKEPKIKVIYETNIVEIEGDGQKVTGVVLDKPYGGSERLVVEGVFVEIGGVPAVGLFKNLGVEFDEEGYLRVDEFMRTNKEGVFGAGDVTDKNKVLAQVVTACASGAVAASSAHEYLKRKGQ